MVALRQSVLQVDRDFADTGVARAALANLTSADLLRLTRIAKARALGLVDFEWQDLLNEAITRMLEGSRRWPIDVPIVAFLAQTMRSIASEPGRHAAQRGTTVDLDGARSLASEDPSPERSVQARQLLKLVLDRFAGDDDVLIYISGYQLGETVAETVSRTGLDAKRLDSARKRMRRSLDRLMDEGCL